MPAEKGLIKRVAVGKRQIRDLLTHEQRAFIEKTAGRAIDFDRLVVLGPLQAHRWRFEDPGCPWAITAELWIRAGRPAHAGGLDQGAGSAGGGRHRRLHGLHGGGRRRARQGAADQDALGTLVLRR